MKEIKRYDTFPIKEVLHEFPEGRVVLYEDHVSQLRALEQRQAWRPRNPEAMLEIVECATAELNRLCEARWSGGETWEKAWHWEIPASSLDTDNVISMGLQVAKTLLAHYLPAPPAVKTEACKECKGSGKTPLTGLGIAVNEARGAQSKFYHQNNEKTCLVCRGTGQKPEGEA